jgi:hypothetical protein
LKAVLTGLLAMPAYFTVMFRLMRGWRPAACTTAAGPVCKCVSVCAYVCACVHCKDGTWMWSLQRIIVAKVEKTVYCPIKDEYIVHSSC